MEKQGLIFLKVNLQKRRYVGSSKRKRSRMEKQELIFLKPKAAKSLLTFALNVI